MRGSRDSGLSCSRCGASAVGGVDGCDEVFTQVIETEFSRPERFQVHRLTVDCYSMQHPEQYMESGKSYAAHLTGMYQAMEIGRDPLLSQATSRWLDGNRKIERSDHPPPRARGDLTILHVQAARDSVEHVARVGEWAASIWYAWAGYHDLARRWVEEMRRRGNR